jgi:hypothetical protein
LHTFLVTQESMSYSQAERGDEMKLELDPSTSLRMTAVRAAWILNRVQDDKGYMLRNRSVRRSFVFTF